MAEEDTNALLREIVNSQRSIEQRLSAIESSWLETWKKYETTDTAYRSELSEYQQERTGIAQARMLATVVRVAILVLLIYVAYRVS